MRLQQWMGFGVVLALSLAVLAGRAATAGEDKGESVEMKALKARATAPKPGDIDSSVTLEALLSKKGASDWSTAKAGTITGNVVVVEREADSDVHIVLAPAGGETDTTRWVIVEVTPSWGKKAASLAEPKLRALRGQRVTVTGWLFYEPDVDGPDPRGTPWELHPVTDIAPAQGGAKQ